MKTRSQTIAVVSRDPALRRFLEVECRLRDYEVVLSDKIPIDPEPFFLVLVDLDSVKASRLDSERIVVLSSAPTKPFAHRLPLPFSLRDFADLLSSKSQEKQRRDYVAPATDTVTLQSEEENRIVFADHTVLLSEYEMLVLRYLTAHAGETVSREALKALLHTKKSNMADVYVCRLRKKLEPYCDKKLIVSVRGVGYRTDLRWCTEEKEKRA